MLKDKDIREPLFEFLEDNYGKIRIFEEKNIGNSRADIIMIMDSCIVGIEIKSDADTYTRLESQVKDYEKFGNMNILVVGSSHAYHAREHIPDHWGIITVEEYESEDKVEDDIAEGNSLEKKNNTEKIDFYYLRKPEENPNVDIEYQLSFLWRPELAHIQEINGMYKYAERSKAFVREKILETVDNDTLIKQITDELFERDYTTVVEKINEYREKNGQKKRRRKKYKRRKKL